MLLPLGFAERAPPSPAGGRGGCGVFSPIARRGHRSAADEGRDEQRRVVLRRLPRPLSPTSLNAAARAIVAIGQRTVVSGGQMCEAIGVSSKPMIERSCGTLRPRWRATWNTPAAISSFELEHRGGPRRQVEQPLGGAHPRFEAIVSMDDQRALERQPRGLDRFLIALASTARVADSAIAEMRSEMRVPMHAMVPDAGGRDGPEPGPSGIPISPASRTHCPPPAIHHSQGGFWPQRGGPLTLALRVHVGPCVSVRASESLRRRSRTGFARYEVGSLWRSGEPSAGRVKGAWLNW